jgi:hypothetical protein
MWLRTTSYYLNSLQHAQFSPSSSLAATQRNFSVVSYQSFFISHFLSKISIGIRCVDIESSENSKNNKNNKKPPAHGTRGQSSKD